MPLEAGRTLARVLAAIEDADFVQDSVAAFVRVRVASATWTGRRLDDAGTSELLDQATQPRVQILEVPNVENAKQWPAHKPNR